MNAKTKEIAEAMDEWRQYGVSGDTRLDVAKALGQLPAVNRRIIVLRVFEELTWAECASAMGYGETKAAAARAKAVFTESALAMKKILTRNPKVVPLVRARLDKRGGI